jgi:hypothetical protein
LLVLTLQLEKRRLDTAIIIDVIGYLSQLRGLRLERRTHHGLRGVCAEEGNPSLRGYLRQCP